MSAAGTTSRRPEPIRWGSVTVPYTAMWTGDSAARKPLPVRETLRGLQPLLFLSEGVNAPGEGKPMFKMLHQDRCREVIRLRLCQMTLRPLHAWVICMNQGQRDPLGPVISDGLPMNPDGARTAFEQCPGLQAQAAAGSLRIWRVPLLAWKLAPVILGHRDPPEGDERVNAILQHMRLYAGPRLVLDGNRARRITPDDLMARRL